LWDVLTQLSVTTLIAFFVFRWSFTAQIGFSLLLLVLTEILYRYTNIPNFDLPFTDQNNFGNYMDLVLMNKINGGGWVAINCIPTAAHTIWGALVGKLLLSARSSNEKITWLLITGGIALGLGLLMDITITPIIKRIATSSFVLASGGWVLLALCFFYWWIDIRSHHRYVQFFIVVGMNSLFIYLFIEIVGGRWFNEYMAAISDGLMSIIHVPLELSSIITSLVIFALEWGMCWFLYQKKIFFKI
jgi:predicted acyltransferase